MSAELQKLVIKGSKKLSGRVSVSGSKNAALKALVAACLTDEEVTIENIPLITDLLIMIDIIKHLGGKVRLNDHSITVKMEKIESEKISLDAAAEIRTSYMFLAPLLARSKKAIIPNPGGCRIGARSIDRIVEGLSLMGVHIDYDSHDGYFHAKTQGLKGATYRFKKNTHTGTETMIIASVLAKGKTVLENAAQEPEIDDLINLLNQMGAKVKRVSPRIIEIEGVEKLNGTTFKISPDRNEIVTFAVAAIITEGDIIIENITENGLVEFLEKMKEAGGGFEKKGNGIRFYYKGKLKPTRVETGFYPGFMTDWQGPWAVLMTKANGESVIHETVYENRFSYVQELEKMGARVDFFKPMVQNPEKVYNFNLNEESGKYPHAVKIYGETKLHNAVVNVSDLRAGATLVLAALAAEGESIVFGLNHLDRGYEMFEKRLKKLGADIKREDHE